MRWAEAVRTYSGRAPLCADPRRWQVVIEVEVRQADVVTLEYSTIAVLRVDDDGTWETTGQSAVFDPEMHVWDRATGERLVLAEEPERWARNLGTALRSGYLVPVITVDEPAESLRKRKS